MTRARLNIFVEPEHARRLEDLSLHRGVSKSSVIAAALSSFLSPDDAQRREAVVAALAVHQHEARGLCRS